MSEAQSRVFVALLLILGIQTASSERLRYLFRHPDQLHAQDTLPGVIAWIAGALALLAAASFAPKATQTIAWLAVILVALSASSELIRLAQKATSSISPVAGKVATPKPSEK
jgi:hypothetical protein